MNRGGGDRGAAVVEFVLVGGLLTLLFAALLQVMLSLYVRNLLIDCAGEGARYGARAGRDPADAVDRTRRLVQADLSDAYARRITADVVRNGGAELLEVRVSAPLPVLGLLGSRTLTVRGHAVLEAPR